MKALFPILLFLLNSFSYSIRTDNDGRFKSGFMDLMKSSYYIEDVDGDLSLDEVLSLRKEWKNFERNSHLFSKIKKVLSSTAAKFLKTVASSPNQKAPSKTTQM